MKTRYQIFSVLLLLAAIVLPVSQGCQKYPDGPGLSFRGRTARLANVWKIDNYKINGFDIDLLKLLHMLHIPSGS